MTIPVAGEAGLLHVGVAFEVGQSVRENWDSVAARLVDGALKGRPELPVRAAFLLATPSWCAPKDSISLPIRQHLRHHLGYDVPLIGGSSPRLFVSLPRENQKPEKHHLQDGVVLVLLCSREIWMNVEMLRNPWKLEDKERTVETQNLVQRLICSRSTHMGLGSSAHYDFFGFLPGSIYGDDQRRTFRDEEIHRDILDATDNSIKLFGASTCDMAQGGHGYQFANDECEKSSLALAVLESDLKQGSELAHDMVFKPKKKILMVTRVKNDVPDGDYVVEKLNGRDAGGVLNKLAQESGTARPIFCVGRSQRAQIAIPSNHPSYNPTVRFTRRLPLGTPLFLLKPTRKDFRQGTIRTLERAIDGIQSAENKPSIKLALGLECNGRYLRNREFDDEAWMQTTTELANRNPELTIVHTLCGGEYGVDFRKRARADSFSALFTVFSSDPLERGFNRRLQARFVKAGRELVRCDTPKKVMEAALKGAIECGASGGQICLYDPATEMLIGRHLGHSESAPNGTQNWEAVLAKTEIHIQKESSPYRLPEAFLQNVTAWPETAPASGQITPPNSADILNIVGANRQAFYVPDSTLPVSHCHPLRVQEGGIEAQFVSPLVGGSDALIGTLQIGFKKDRRVDREEVGLWVSYSQAVAAALERALENQQRTAMELINNAWNDALQLPLQRPDWNVELLKFTQIVKEAIRVDYVHLRIDQQPEPSGRYDLYASAGDLATVHREVRPTLTEEQGSIRIARQLGTLFTNRRAETEEYYLQASEATNGGVSQNVLRTWEEETQKPASVAIIAMWFEGRFEGATILDSHSEFAFTERNQSLARFAAEKVASLVARLRTVEVHQKRFDMGLFAAQTIHDIMGPLANIQKLVDLLRSDSLDERTLEWINLIEKEKNRAAQLFSKNAEGMKINDTQEPLNQYLAREFPITQEFPGRFFKPSVKDAQLMTSFWLTFALRRLIENAEEAAGDGGFVSCQCFVDADGKIRLIVENSGVLLTEQDVEAMKKVGFSGKSGTHLGLGVPLAYIGIDYAHGQLQLHPRAEGGLVATVTLRALSNPTERTFMSTR